MIVACFSASSACPAPVSLHRAGCFHQVRTTLPLYLDRQHQYCFPSLIPWPMLRWGGAFSSFGLRARKCQNCRSSQEMTPNKMEKDGQPSSMLSGNAAQVQPIILTQRLMTSFKLEAAHGHLSATPNDNDWPPANGPRGGLATSDPEFGWPQNDPSSTL